MSLRAGSGVNDCDCKPVCVIIIMNISRSKCFVSRLVCADYSLYLSEELLKKLCSDVLALKCYTRVESC